MNVHNIMDLTIEKILLLPRENGTKLDVIDVLLAIRKVKEEYGCLEVKI